MLRTFGTGLKTLLIMALWISLLGALVIAICRPQLTPTPGLPPARDVHLPAEEPVPTQPDSPTPHFSGNPTSSQSPEPDVAFNSKTVTPTIAPTVTRPDEVSTPLYPNDVPETPSPAGIPNPQPDNPPSTGQREETSQVNPPDAHQPTAEPTATPLPIPTATSQPEPTATPTVVPTPIPTPTPVPTPTPLPTPTPVPTSTAVPTATPRPTPTPLPPPTPTVPPVAEGIIIECIFFDGAVPRTESDEYVQIINTGREVANLADWRLTDVSDGSPTFRFPLVLLNPGQRIRVYTNELHPEWGGFSFGRQTAIWSNSDPDTAGLFNSLNSLVSTKSYPPGC